MNAAEIAERLGNGDAAAEAALFAAARSVRRECGRDVVLPRGLVEIGNRCARNCLYCGIRSGNAEVGRYRMIEDEVRQCLAEAVRRGYPAVAFQSGELESEANTAYVERLLRLLGEFDDGDRRLEVTLSLGEQTPEVYERWRSAAAGRTLRYLIRIESSDPALFARIHGETDDRAYERRLGCIRTLKRLGYVTGSGVMIGLPGQSFGSLAEDILFFRRERLDMVGMGPYIPTPGTPLAETVTRSTECRAPRESVPVWTPGLRFRTALRMIALVRLELRDINIVAASALEALSPRGRELGLDAGANVIMPVLTPDRYRADYALYPGKSV